MAAYKVRRSEPPHASNADRERPSWAQMQESIEEVAAACQQGDRTAQHRLYEVSHQNVYRLMVRMVGVQDAGDVTQQVYLRVFRKINLFTGRSQFGTWMYRVAVNEALQHLRRAKRLRGRLLEQEPMDRSPDSHDNVDDKELLEKALGTLDPELRSAFLLREVEGLAYREIAHSLQIPEGTVASRLNRARRELRQRLKELGWRGAI